MSLQKLLIAVITIVSLSTACTVPDGKGGTEWSGGIPPLYGRWDVEGTRVNYIFPFFFFDDDGEKFISPLGGWLTSSNDSVMVADSRFISARSRTTLIVPFPYLSHSYEFSYRLDSELKTITGNTTKVLLLYANEQCHGEIPIYADTAAARMVKRPQRRIDELFAGKFKDSAFTYHAINNSSNHMTLLFSDNRRDSLHSFSLLWGLLFDYRSDPEKKRTRLSALTPLVFYHVDNQGDTPRSDWMFLPPLGYWQTNAPDYTDVMFLTPLFLHIRTARPRRMFFPPFSTLIQLLPVDAFGEDDERTYLCPWDL